jgi:hypothetical protein
MHSRQANSRAVVLANLADGLSAEEIVKSYPSLTVTGIQAALAYAAALAQERVLPLPAQLRRMRAKLDENRPVEAAELLRTAGWEYDTVYDEGLAGATIPKLQRPARQRARALHPPPRFRGHPGLPAVRVRRHRRTATNGTQSSASNPVGEPRASGPVV